MTLDQIRTAGANFAFNEITGKLIQFFEAGLQEERMQIWIEGDNSPKTFVLSLFAKEEIAKNWTPLSPHEADEVIHAYHEKLAGAGNRVGESEG